MPGRRFGVGGIRLAIVVTDQTKVAAPVKTCKQFQNKQLRLSQNRSSPADRSTRLRQQFKITQT